jgi:hypothetical protein
MAYRVTNGAGTAFNTAANWDEGVNTPSIHASTNITVSSGGVFSAVFTAPNLTNAGTGVIVPVAARGTAGNIIATLQHDVGAGFVDCAGATATIAITSLVASTHVFFKFGTKFVFDTTTAGKFRVKLNTSGASGTTTIAADSGGSNFAYIVFMDNNVVPTTGDDIFVVSPNQGSSLVIDLDSSPSFGSGGNTAVPTFRSWQNGIVIANSGVLAWSTSTSRTITLKGNFIVENGGEHRMGTTSGKVAAGVTARLAFDQNGTTANYGYQLLNGGKCTLQGTSKTYNKTTLSSGTGTAASPLVTVDSVDWSVNDELYFVPVSNNAANYNEGEMRFIKTKNSATSYVLSSTVGGAESALANSHTAGYIFNLTRQVLIDTTNTSFAWYADFANLAAASNVNIDGARLETFGSVTANKTTIIFSNIATELCELDDIVFYRNSSTTAVNLGNNNDTRTYTWLIFYSGNALFVPGSLRNKTFQNIYFLNSTGTALSFNATANCTFATGGIWSSATSGTGQGIVMTNSTKCTFTDFEIHATRNNAIRYSSAVDMTFVDCLFGTKGKNETADIDLSADTYNTGLYDNCLFGSNTLITNYTTSADGSDISINKYNQTANDHRWYTPYGMARSTGAGLADTTVRTAGSLGLRIAPESSSTGFSWDFKVLARASSAVSIIGFIQKNAAFSTDDVTVDLYLPGLVPGTDTPSATVTMPDDTNWNVFNLAASYSGTVPLYATVRITGKTTTSAAYLYVDDLYNGTNVITGLDTWHEGKPSDIMFEQLGDSAAVWAVATSTLTTAGTTGYKLTNVEDAIWDEATASHTTTGTTGKKLADDLTTGKFLALK